jgi:hypothetical protein
MIKCYEFMPQLPPVPAQFIDQALTCAVNLDNEEQSRHHDGSSRDYRREVLRNQKIEIARNNIRVAIGPEIEQWVHHNISQEFTRVGVSTSIGNTSCLQSPHTDGTRSYALIYLIDLSNEDQDTVFWQEPGRTLHRKRLTISYDLDSLNQIDSVRIPLHQWCYLDATILHSIENIQQRRIAIQVSFDCDPFGVFSRS